VKIIVSSKHLKVILVLVATISYFFTNVKPQMC
jgi:hypothetical protein